MDQNENLTTQNLESVIIFSKKELFLIFLFLILVAIISFAIGVRVGRNISHNQMGITKEDHQKVLLKSQKEEDVESVIQQLRERDKDTATNEEVDEGYRKLREEFKKMNDEALEKKEEKKSPNPQQERKAFLQSDSVPDSQDRETREKLRSKTEDRVLKYTIQLGSYQYKDDAVRFADGFRIRGYNPIIREVPLENKGVWYRVALGTFESVSEAKKYIEAEESLFAGQDYIITEF